MFAFFFNCFFFCFVIPMLFAYQQFRMLLVHRLRLLLRQLLKGVPNVPTLSTEGKAQNYVLERYLNEDSIDERLTDLFSSISSLDIATQEDWFCLKRISYTFLPQMSCRGVNQIFNHLAKNDVCSQVECVKFQETMSEAGFSTNLRIHEQLQAFHNIAIVGSRISPCFFQHALESIERMIEKCQPEKLPLVAYILGRVILSGDNGTIPKKIGEMLWRKLLLRVESLDYFILSQTEIYYLLWSLSTFCLPSATIRRSFAPGVTSIFDQGIQTNNLKEASPRDLLLLFNSLCSILSYSEASKATLAHQSSGIILDVSTTPKDCKFCSSVFLEHVLRILDVVSSLLIRQIAQGIFQNYDKLVGILEMITISGATKLLKNAQILFHLVVRAILFKGCDVWIKSDESTSGVDLTYKCEYLVNWYVFSGELDLLDLLTLRLALPLPAFDLLNEPEKLSGRVVVAVLEGLVYGNISDIYRKSYLDVCRAKLPRIIRCCSRDDFEKIASFVSLLHVSDATVLQALKGRAQELNINLQLNPNVDKHLRSSFKEPVTVKKETTSLTLLICEKANELISQNDSSGSTLYDLIANLDKRARLESATAEHCLAIIKSMSKGSGASSWSETQRAHLTAVFSRLKTRLSTRSTLSAIAYGIKSGVLREELINALSGVESMMICEDLKMVKMEDAVAYLVLASELGALTEFPHPAIVAALTKDEVIDAIHPLTSMRVIGVCLTLGLEKMLTYKRLFNILDKINAVDKDFWVEDNLKSFIFMIHAMWTWNSVEVTDQLLMVVDKFLPSFTEICTGEQYEMYFLQLATTIGTVIRVSDGRSNIIGPHSASQLIEKFVFLVTRLFSDDGFSLSLARVEMILSKAEKQYTFIPECSAIVSLLIISHTMQFLTQMENSVVKKLTSLSVGLWRFSLNYVERMWSNATLKTHAILHPLAFSIQFGASSQIFDRLMTSLMESGENVSMSIVCRVVDGLLRTGKRRPTATQFVAHFIQNKSLDNVPASALLSLILFITRDAERVALGLTRSDMLITLIWSSLSLKIEKLPHSKETLKLFETVPEESIPEFLSFISNTGLLKSVSLVELYQPLSLALAWHGKTKNNTIITEFLKKAKLVLENRSVHSMMGRNTEELIQMIAAKVY